MDEFSAIEIIDVFVETITSSFFINHSHVLLEFRSSCLNQIPIKLIWNPTLNCSLSYFEHHIIIIHLSTKEEKVPIILNEIRPLHSDECPLIGLLFPNHIIVEHVILIVLFILCSL